MWGRMLAAETETGTASGTAAGIDIDTNGQETEQGPASAAAGRTTSGSAAAVNAASAAGSPSNSSVGRGSDGIGSIPTVAASTTTVTNTAEVTGGGGGASSNLSSRSGTAAATMADESAKSFVTASQDQEQDESARSFASRGTGSGSYSSYRPEASSSAKTFKASNTTGIDMGITSTGSAVSTPASGRISANMASRRLLVSHEEEEEGEEEGDDSDDDDNWSFDDDAFDQDGAEGGDGDDDTDNDDNDSDNDDGTPEKSNTAAAAAAAATKSATVMTPNRTVDKILGHRSAAAADVDGVAAAAACKQEKKRIEMDRKQKEREEKKSPDKSGRRSQFAGTKSGSKMAAAAGYQQGQQQEQQQQQQQQNEQTWQERSASSSLSNLGGGGGGGGGENSRHNSINDDDNQQGSWPALIDFEASIAGNEFADAADNMNDSSRSVGSIRSWEEHKRLEADVAFIVRNDTAERKKVRKAGSDGGGGGGDAAAASTSSSGNKPPTGMPPISLMPTPLMAAPHAPIPLVVDTSPDKNSKSGVDATPRVENKSSGGGSGGVSTGSRLKPPSKVVSKVQTRSQANVMAAAAAPKEEPSSPTPPSRMQPRRVGPAAGTRSAVKAEMALAKRKVAAAVQKIEDEDEDDNWDFDDDDDDDDDLDHFDTPAGTPPSSVGQQSPALSSQLHENLVEYTASLAHASSPLITSLNSVLDAELNTSENALELIHYYHTRPNLLQYTVETELPRMDYLVVTDSNQFIDKDDIKLYVESTEDRRDDTEALLWRAANQSLLADLIATLTGDDRLIRQSMMVTAVAEFCKFELDLQRSGGSGSPRSINAICDLVLSIPSGSDDANSPTLALGTVRARIRFVPEANAVDYSLVSCSASLSPENNPADGEKLRSAALTLERDLAELAAPVEMNPHVDHLSRTAHDDLRDQFLATVSTGAGGLKTALKEIDNVTNVSGKIGWMKGLAEAAMPSLPTQEELDALEREQTEHTAHSSDSFPNHETGVVVAGARFPRPPATSTQPDEKTRSIFDRISDAPVQSQQPKTPPQPAARAMGFLDRLVNEIDVPQERQNQFPRVPPPQPQPQPQHHPTLAETSSAPARPPPLIGGMLLSGFNKLAMAATAPDVDLQEQSTTFPRPAETGVQRPAYPLQGSYQQPSASAHHTMQQEQNQASPITEPSQDGRDDDKLVADADDTKSGWSDEGDLDLDDTKEEDAVPNELKASPKSSNPGPANSILAQQPAPEASSLPLQTSPSNQSPNQTSRFVSQVPPGPPSGSVCDSTGSFTFVSMTSLEKELPEVQNWIELEAVEDYDSHTGVIPTRKRWQPRRMRVTK